MLWWRDKYEREPPIEDHWVSFMLGDREVARCKYIMTGARADPVLGDFPHGQLDILAFEVAVPMRRKGGWPHGRLSHQEPERAAAPDCFERWRRIEEVLMMGLVAYWEPGRPVRVQGNSLR